MSLSDAKEIFVSDEATLEPLSVTIHQGFSNLKPKKFSRKKCIMSLIWEAHLRAGVYPKSYVFTDSPPEEDELSLGDKVFDHFCPLLLDEELFWNHLTETVGKLISVAVLGEMSPPKYEYENEIEEALLTINHLEEGIELIGEELSRSQRAFEEGNELLYEERPGRLFVLDTGRKSRKEISRISSLSEILLSHNFKRRRSWVAGGAVFSGEGTHLNGGQNISYSIVETPSLYDNLSSIDYVCEYLFRKCKNLGFDEHDCEIWLASPSNYIVSILSQKMRRIGFQLSRIRSPQIAWGWHPIGCGLEFLSSKEKHKIFLSFYENGKSIAVFSDNKDGT